MKKLMSLAGAVLLLAGAAEAKWWIFGKGNAEVSLTYLHVNKLAADEAGKTLTLYRETLPPDGMVRISGKAYVGKGRVGAIRLSLDDKASWKDVPFADNGTFDFSFKPEVDRTYVLYVEVTDTAGKMNNVENTRKEIVLSTDNIQARVRETLNDLFQAYMQEDLPRFMRSVSDNFASDPVVLERAVKRDLDALNNIQLRYTLNNVASGAAGRVFASITYNRTVSLAKTGQSNTDGGVTEFVFDVKGGDLKLFSMKQPLMFGLSDADNVATGSTLGNDGDSLTLDESGNLGGTGVPVTFSNPNRNTSTRSYTFADESLALEGDFIMSLTFTGDIAVDIAHIAMNSNVEGKVMAGKTLSELTLTDLTAPGWSGSNPLTGSVNPGDVFAFKVNGSKYYAIEIVSNDMGDPSFTVVTRVRTF